MAKNKGLSIVLAIILVLVALISFFGFAKVYSDPAMFEKTISVLDEQKNTVAKISAGSFAAAAAIDLIPGDTGKSISEALVDLGGYCVLIFAALYFEKILLAIGGVAAFKVFIPLGCIVLAIFVLFKQEALKKAGLKMIAIGLVAFLLVPTSVWISQRVESIYESSNGTTVQETIDSLDSETSSVSENVNKQNESKVGSLFNKAKTAITGSVDKFNDILDNLIETIAFFIVTTCLMPIIVLVLLLVLINQILGTNINVGSFIKSPLQAKKKIKASLSAGEAEE